MSVHAEEISLAVAGLLIESVLAEAEALHLRVLWALESQVAGGVTVGHYVGPVAVVGFGAESQAFRAFEEISTTVNTVQELIALVRRASHPEVSELMWAIFRWICWLQKSQAEAN